MMTEHNLFYCPYASPPQAQPSELEDWIVIYNTNNTQEDARWISSQLLRDLLAEGADRSSIRSSEFRLKGTTQQLKTLLSVPGPFVDVTEEDQRFEYLVDRSRVLEQVAKQLAFQTK